MKHEEKIKQVLEEIRPSLQADGGDIEFISWDAKKGLVKVQLVGMCATCPMAHVTLQEGVTKHLQKQIPEVKQVENV